MRGVVRNKFWLVFRPAQCLSMPRANALHTRHWLIRGFLLCESHHCSYFHFVLKVYHTYRIVFCRYNFFCFCFSNLLVLIQTYPGLPPMNVLYLVCCIYTLTQLSFKAPVLNLFLNHGFILFLLYYSFNYFIQPFH